MGDHDLTCWSIWNQYSDKHSNLPSASILAELCYYFDIRIQPITLILYLFSLFQIMEKKKVDNFEYFLLIHSFNCKLK